MPATDAMRRYGAMYGSALRDGKTLAEVVEVSGAVEINRVEVPLVGQIRQGYKRGRETREGTMRIHKIDAFWEIELYSFLAVGLATRRTARDLDPVNGPATSAFDLALTINDPEAWGYETWTLGGCVLWRLPIGFSITDDLIDREFPLTWETETPTHVFIVQDVDTTHPNLVNWKQGDTVPSRNSA